MTYTAGIKDYRETCRTPDYVPLDSDLLAVFKIAAQAGVPKEEAAPTCSPTWTTQ